MMGERLSRFYFLSQREREKERDKDKDKERERKIAVHAVI